MRIREIIIREIHLPLREPFTTVHGMISHRRLGIIEIIDENGFTGWGECSALELPDYLPETIDTSLQIMRDHLVPLLLNFPFASPREIAVRFTNHVRGWYFAKAALEMATWDLFAKNQNLSLANVLGGTREKVATGLVIGLQKSPERLAEKAKNAVEAGYQRLKIKIKPGADMDYLAAVRYACGNMPIVADANSAYSDLPFEQIKKFDAFNLDMIEQPLAWNDHLRHAALQEKLQTPICLDESILSYQDCELMHNMGSGRIINLKPGRVGGLSHALQIHDFCLKNRIPLWCGGMLESGIGRAHNVALAALPGFTLPGDLSPSARYWEKDSVSPEWTMDENGWITVPLDKPGIGVEVDREFLEKVTKEKMRFF